MAINEKAYIHLLKQFLQSPNDTDLVSIRKMGRQFIEHDILPEEMIRIHINSMKKMPEQLSNNYKLSMEFLLQAMIAYRLAYNEIEMLREEQFQLKSEIELAASMQQTFLATTVPEIEGLDIGVVSVPLHQMNGDYYHFVKGEDGSLGVAIADVIGKGVPAALSMSMIKYSMDSIHKDSQQPEMILRNLNRVVERNVTPNMFITMFYGLYDPKSSRLLFASAGHEPGFFYNSKESRYEEIKAKGLVLGVLPDTTYNQYELKIDTNDTIILLTDGVTECMYEDRFIEREEVLEVIKQYAHLRAQDQAEHVYNHFKSKNNFLLKDDFTLIVLKKVV